MTVASPQPYGYRNRITVHSHAGKVGFLQRGSHEIVDVAHCPIASEPVNAALADLRSRRPHDGVRTLRADPHRRGFYQTNDAVAACLADAVAAACAPGGGHLIDAYCGNGFFGRRVAAMFERIVGIEWSEAAIEAVDSASVPNFEIRAGDIEHLLPPLLAECHPDRTTLILDPPATGLSTMICSLISRFPAKQILYISCDPSTLARDLHRIADRHILEWAQPFDMFSQTAEIETLAVLRPVERPEIR